MQSPFLELPAELAIERVAAAAADHEREANQEEHQRELGAARGSEVAVRHLDHQHDHAELDGEGERDRPREQPEREQDHAVELEVGDDPGPEQRRLEAGLQDVAGGDARRAFVEDLLPAARQDKECCPPPRDELRETTSEKSWSVPVF